MKTKKKQKWFRELLKKRLFFCLLILIQTLFLIYFILSRSIASAVLNAVLQLTSLIVALHIISRRDKEAYKLTWVFFILIFPVFGGLTYLLFRCQTRSKKYLRRVQGIRASVKAAQLPSAYPQAATAFDDRARQIGYLENYAGFPIYENRGAEYLSPGERFLERLLADLETAEQYIFIESFIIEDGEMWQSVLSVLKRKAAGGVNVRIIYDDMGCFLRLPRHFISDMRRHGIQCDIFNRFVPLLTAVQNFRDHRKIVAIDGRIAYTGGLNIADEYINKISPFGHWKDAGVRVEGDGAFSLALIFLEMWMMMGHGESDLSAYRPQDFGARAEACRGFVQPYAATPLEKDSLSEGVYMQMIGKAKKYVYIMTPYLIVDNNMLFQLTLAAKSGVDVRIMTPYHWDKRIVHFMTRSYYRELIRAGVKIYEYTPGFLHAKTFVCDDEIATVGSANMDFRSLYLQFECGALFCGGDVVGEVRDDFLQTVPVCKAITEADCRSNALVRFVQDVFRLLAPLM
ncbi:MAG: cardiolipin synthase [Clostridia bacterium]|nr:cardiolipin synthase [Clostridia bacterium]